jgi:hypothetical protein
LGGDAWKPLPAFFIENSYNLLIAILALSNATVVPKSFDYIKIQSMLTTHPDIASSPQF